MATKINNGDEDFLIEKLLKAMESPRYQAVQEKINEKMVQKMNLIIQEFHTMKAECKQLRNDNMMLKQTQRAQEERIEKLEEKLVIREKQNKNQNLRINGLKEEKDENTTEKVVNFIKQNLSINITAQDIVSAHRVGRKYGEKPRTVFTRFNSVWKKDEVYDSRFSLQNLEEKVFINEDLTEENMKLFFEARKLVRAKVLYTTFTKHGIVHVKKRKGGKNVKVQNMNTLAYMSGESSSSENEEMSVRERMELSEMTDSSTFSMSGADSMLNSGFSNP